MFNCVLETIYVILTVTLHSCLYTHPLSNYQDVQFTRNWTWLVTKLSPQNQTCVFLLTYCTHMSPKNRLGHTSSTWLQERCPECRISSRLSKLGVSPKHSVSPGGESPLERASSLSIFPRSVCVFCSYKCRNGAPSWDWSEQVFWTAMYFAVLRFTSEWHYDIADQHVWQRFRLGETRKWVTLFPWWTVG